MWKSIYIPGATGSEGGVVLEDEEYDGECRITRERCEKYDAITCGVYGDMVHTAFAPFDKSKEAYDSMKSELQLIILIETDICSGSLRLRFAKVLTCSDRHSGCGDRHI